MAWAGDVPRPLLKINARVPGLRLRVGSMRLEVRHLELLLAVERAGSISGAARLLGTDQPHVTRQLRRIEDQLKFVVFERTGSGTHATAAGIAVLDQARTAIRALAGLGDRAGVTIDSLRVLYRWLDMTPIATYLRSQRPGIAVTSAAAEPAAGRAELLAGTADLFLVLRLPHMPWPDPGRLSEIELVSDPTMVYLSVDHPLAGKEEIDLRDLAGSDWITGTDVDTIRMAREECRLLGGFEPRISYRSAENVLTRRLLETGLGVVFGARSSVRGAGFVARRYRGATPAHWMLLHRPDVLPPRVIGEIADTVRASYRDALARAEDDERRRTTPSA